MLMDFESASINGFNEVYPGIEQRECYFHHSQCIWRNIQKYPNILQKYKDRDDPDFALHLRQLAALAFVPVQAVVSSFDILMETPFFEDNEALLRPLINYYEDTWIGKSHR